MPLLLPPLKWKLPKLLDAAFREDPKAAPELWLSGGAALRVILGMENTGVWKGDWDLYSTPAAFSRLQQRSGLSFEQQDHQFSAIYDLYSNAAEGLHVFVGKQFKLPTTIYRSFDLSVVQLALSAGGVIFDPVALGDILEGSVRVINANTETPHRLEKYIARGFRPISSERK